MGWNVVEPAAYGGIFLLSHLFVRVRLPLLNHRRKSLTCINTHVPVFFNGDERYVIRWRGK